MRHFDTVLNGPGRICCLLGLVMIMPLLFSHCGTKSGPPLEDYYFPVEELQQGRVYVYEMSSQMAPEYWYIKSFIEDDSVILTITVYDAMQRQVQLSRERMFGSGWVQRDLFLYAYDSIGTKRIEADIINDDLYPFNVKDSLDVALYAAAWESEQQGELVRNRIFRNRRWMRKDTMEIMGQSIPVMIFKVDDHIEDERKGTLQIETESWEFYGKDWGLVKKDQYIDGELFRSFYLSDTMQMQEFEEIFKERIEHE